MTSYYLIIPLMTQPLAVHCTPLYRTGKSSSDVMVPTYDDYDCPTLMLESHSSYLFTSYLQVTMTNLDFSFRIIFSSVQSAKSNHWTTSNVYSLIWIFAGHHCGTAHSVAHHTFPIGKHPRHTFPASALIRCFLNHICFTMAFSTLRWCFISRLCRESNNVFYSTTAILT